MKSLADCRVAIDEIDDKILELLNNRMKVVERVGEIKHESGGAIYRPEREQEIIDRLYQKSLDEDGILNKEAIEALFLEIFAISRNLELPEKIAYLGPEGSFTHQAAESRFGAMSDYLPLNSIHAVFNAMESKRAKFGVVPIENSRDGAVGETLDLLAKSSYKIVAELYMPIHLSFVSSARHLKDIKRIYSKDKGFGQCRDFLLEHELQDIEQIPVESTAKAAKLAAVDPEAAAICSHIAAKLYNVPNMFENIEDVDTNTTRFVILSNFENVPHESSKTSILVRLKDGKEAGALANFLADFEKADINISKIESRPSKESDGFGYWFFIDFYGHIKDKKLENILEKRAGEITWLGSYVKGDK